MRGERINGGRVWHLVRFPSGLLASALLGGTCEREVFLTGRHTRRGPATWAPRFEDVARLYRTGGGAYPAGAPSLDYAHRVRRAVALGVAL